MIVADYWAEARLQGRRGNKRVTVRRYGWSDVSQDDAQQVADARAAEALEQWQRGDLVESREPKRAYNGATGTPIREEIIARHDDTVITRNSYGAHCLNSPDVLFVDVDFDSEVPPKLIGLLLLFALATPFVVWVASGSGKVALITGLCALVLMPFLPRWIASVRSQFFGFKWGSKESTAMQRVAAFAARNPTWNLQVYRTPAGLRVMAVHTTFSPSSAEVHACFNALKADSTYALMCRNQQCFRARLTAKPWRVGVTRKLRPRPGVWPIALARMPLRQEWVAAYEDVAKRFAACRWVAQFGSSTTDPKALAVQALHDNLSGARSSLPLA
jgi:hypothetical protein